MTDVPSFTLDLPVRISEVNYGNHLGHAALASLLHQARLKLYKQHNINELNIDGTGAIVKKLKIEYQGEAFFDDILHIRIQRKEATGATYTFEYFVTKNNDHIEVAHVLETMAFTNIESHRATRIPPAMKKLLAS